MDKLDAWLLEGHPAVGHVTVNTLLHAAREAQQPWQAWLKGLPKQAPVGHRLRAAALFSESPRYAKLCSDMPDTLAKLDATVVLPGCRRRWPPGLKNLDRRQPPVLVGLGNARLLETSATAIIGRREVGPAGLGTVSEWVAELCAANQTVLSGGARGTDWAAHEGALIQGGRTIVIAPQPPAEAAMRYARWLNAYPDQILVLCQFPVRAARAASHLLIRNATVAAMAREVWIADLSPQGGGTAHTARQAQALSRRLRWAEHLTPPLDGAAQSVGISGGVQG